MTVRKDNDLFAPGKKPYLDFEHTILNDNVPWRDILHEILANSKFSARYIAKTLKVEVLDCIINGNGCPIRFK